MTAAGSFAHEALFYRGLHEFVASVTTVVDEARRSGGPVLIVLPGDKLELLRDALAPADEGVGFADMEQLGRNPARLLWIWQHFAALHAGTGPTPLGIGEPLFDRRTPDEAVECHHQEALFNAAFATAPPWRLVCPYDVSALRQTDVEGARRSHPVVIERGRATPSNSYVEPPLRPLDAALSGPPNEAIEQPVSLANLRQLRALVRERAARAGLPTQRMSDLVVAASELATNSLRHSLGHGTLRIWCEDGAVVVEVKDDGHIADPFVGRRQPPVEEPGGRGLWLVNQLCDLVQLRSSEAGTVVRARVCLA